VISLKDRVEGIADDPKKLKRAFTFIWVVAYAMLILGLILIIWVYLYT